MKSFKIKSYLGLAAFAVTALLNGCADDYPSATVNPYANDLLGLKIINAQDGNGNTVQLEGTIDEDKKTVKFPRVNIATDFSKIVVVATTSQGAKITLMLELRQQQLVVLILTEHMYLLLIAEWVHIS